MNAETCSTDARRLTDSGRTRRCGVPMSVPLLFATSGHLRCPRNSHRQPPRRLRLPRRAGFPMVELREFEPRTFSFEGVSLRRMPP